MLRLLLALLTLLIAPTAIQAQIGLAWTALIYESNSGTVTHIDYEGATLNEFVLPVEPRLSVHGLAIAASPDGSTLAYTLANNASGNVTEAHLNLYDVASASIIASYPFAAGADINSFNQASLKLRPHRDGEAFATGYGYFVDDELTWEIVSLSAVSGNSQVLTRANAEALGLDLPDFSYPIVLNYADNEITFTLIPFEGFLTEYPTYTWNLIAEQVFEISSVSLPTQVSLSGSQLTLDFDESLPALPNPPQMGFVEPYNALVLNTRTIYHTDEFMLTQAHFVTDETQIAVYTATADIQLARHILDLEGRVLHTEAMPNGLPAIYGTPDGFLVLDYVPDQNPIIKHILAADGSFSERAIWTGTAPASYTITVLPA